MSYLQHERRDKGQALVKRTRAGFKRLLGPDNVEKLVVATLPEVFSFAAILFKKLHRLMIEALSTDLEAGRQE
jgi:hypothetical protein